MGNRHIEVWHRWRGHSTDHVESTMQSYLLELGLPKQSCLCKMKCYWGGCRQPSHPQRCPVCHQRRGIHGETGFGAFSSSCYQSPWLCMGWMSSRLDFWSILAWSISSPSFLQTKFTCRTWTQVNVPSVLHCSGGQEGGGNLEPRSSSSEVTVWSLACNKEGFLNVTNWH